MKRKRHLLSVLTLTLLMSWTTLSVQAQSLWGISSRKAKPKSFVTAEMSLRGAYPDRHGGFSLFKKKRSYKQFLRLLGKLEKDSRVKAVIFRIGGLAVGMAKAVGMQQAIARLSKAGKRTYALIETSSTTDYIVALGCQKIAMAPGGMLYLPGIRSESLYYKGLLDKLGMEGDFVTIGAFKTAPEPFMRSSMSKSQRKQLNRLLGDLYNYIVESIASHRNNKTVKPVRALTQAEAKAAIDVGLLDDKSAMAHHLIDIVASRLALRKLVLKEVPQRPLRFTSKYGKVKKRTPTSIWSLFSMLMRSRRKKLNPKKPKIAVIYAQGPIYYGSSAQDWRSSEAEIWSDNLIHTINKVSKLPNLRAVVLRVNSPGGDALASDLIWKRLEKLKKRVPLFVSMGNVAASGGYYIAMGADVLVAQPTTITGSIGVFGGKLVMTGAMKKLGIHIQTVSRGKHSGIFSTFSKFSKTERATLKKLLLNVYKTFTTKAAKGRKMKLSQLLQLAGGQVWTGRQAKQSHLVDRLGSLQDTIDIAIKRTGLKPGQATIVTYPRPKSLFEAFKSMSSAERTRRLPYAQHRLMETLMRIAIPQVHRLRLLLNPKRSILTWTPIPQLRF